MDSIIVVCAKYLFVAVVLLWIAAWLQAGRRHKAEIALSTVIAVVIAAILDKIGSKLYYDPRPFVSHHLHPLVAHIADNGFPSEHTLFSATLAAVFIFYRPKVGWAAMVIAVIVGIARVAAHVHSPIDIIGGLAMGVIAGYLGYLAGQRLLAPKKNPPARNQARPGAGRPADPR